MKAPLVPACPSCAETNPRRIGALPAVGVFAGHDAPGVLAASSLYRCVGCGLLFRHPVLAAHEYDALYGNAGAACWSGEQERTDWALIQDYLARSVAAGARVLDFGCHTGGLLKRLGARYARTGIEVNERAARIARQESGADVFTNLGALPRGARFDAIIAADVIEHFPDPGKVLASLLEALEHGGTLIVTTGDAEALLWRVTGTRWWYCYYPEHLAFISERWMRDWLRRTGSDARIVAARTFRYQLLSAPRFAVQSLLLAAYVIAPGGYTRVGGGLRRLLGRKDTAYPPGVGLTRDHVFVALRKAA